MITAIIPVLNESSTIVEIVHFARRNPLVTQVIVVDDGSIDGTPALARQAGAEVVTSTLLGKGASMEDGMRNAVNEIIIYLDGDLSGLRHDLIEHLSRPLLENEAEFVKGKFSRRAGRVTTLTAKPLLRLFFPEVAHFDQPLGGIIAAKKSLLQQLRFETDYGVDVGLLLDAAALGTRVAEIDIGHIEHDSHPLEILGDMSTQVVRTIFDRADRYGRFSISQVREVEEVERRMQAELAVVVQRVGPAKKLALFDMDGVLLRDRYVTQLAKRLDLTSELEEYLDHAQLDSITRSQRICRLFTNVPMEIFVEVAREMELSSGARHAVVALRASGFRVGIVTDSYFVAAEIIRRRVFADFSIGHIIKFDQGRSTGQVVISPAMSHKQGCQEHTFCKHNALLHLIEKFSVERSHVLAVGDSDNDICMLRSAGIGIAYAPKSLAVREAADHVIDNLAYIPDIANAAERPQVSTFSF